MQARSRFVAGRWLAPPAFVAIWATGFIVARLVAPHADPLHFLVLRYALAASVLALLAAATGAPWPRTRTSWRDGLVAGVLLHGFYLGGVFWAVKQGMPAGIAALMAGLQPLVTALLAGPLLGEVVSPRRWLGIAIGFAGAALVIAPKLGGEGGFPLVAVLVCFGGVVSMALGTLWQKRHGAGADLRTNVAVQYVGAGLATLPLALLTEPGRFELVPEALLGLFWAVVGLSIGGVLLLMLLIRRGAVAGVASLLYLVPPVTALMAYPLFGEALLPIQLGGMALAVAGVAVASRG
jgi:drug/metabolite transporter (DMT)-like permease